MNSSIIANSSGVASECNEFPGGVLYSCFHLVNVSITSVETCKSRSVMSSKVQSEEELSPKFFVMAMLEITYSFFFFTLIAIPVMINLDYLLQLWLVNVPEYTSEFLQLALCAALINSIAQPLVTVLQATGKIKIFQISICIVMLLELPLAYLILFWGGKPYMAMYPTIFVVFIGLFVRFVILMKLVPAYNLKYFTLAIVGRNIVIGTICYMISKVIHSMFNTNFLSLILTTLISCIITSIIIYLLGITHNERIFINRKFTYLCLKSKKP